MAKVFGMEINDLADSNSFVEIGGNLYVKNKEALDIILNALPQKGYSIKDIRKENESSKRGVTHEEMEKNGWYLWYVQLVNFRKGKCGTCSALISTSGIRAHGHRCENCNAVTYATLRDGSSVQFSFLSNDERRRFCIADVEGKVKRWDAESGDLYLYAPLTCGQYLKPEHLEAYLEQHKDKWEEVYRWGKRLIRVRYSAWYENNDRTIDMRSSHGHYFNHRVVRVWNGKEYDDMFDSFPMQEHFHIYEAWHWAPLKPSPTLHRALLHAIGNTDDKGWHHQDGSPWFKRKSFEEMGTFVRHFTTLDADLWDKASPHFRVDGPGGIDDVAFFCHDTPDVQDRPNIVNLINGLSKALNGQRLSSRERYNVDGALADRDIRSTFMQLIHTSRRHS